MTTENEQTNNTEKAIEPGDLGKLLREYRGIAHLDISQIADTLCLTPTAINSLETEAFDKLPEPPYVRGYLRNYARLADQDPKHITRVYEVLRGAAPEEENDNGIVSLAATSSYQDVANPLITPQRFRLALLAGFLLLLGVLTMIPSVRDWTGSLWSSFSTPNNTENIVEVGAKAQDSLNLPSLTDDLPGNLPISPDGTDNADNSSTDSNTEAPDVSGQEEVKSVQADNSQSANNSSESESADDSALATENKNKENSSTAATDTSLDNATQEQTTEEELVEGNTSLKFIFAQEVWLRINGKDGSIVYEALHPAGTEKILTLNSPLTLKVGNAPAMQLFVNGAEMDTTEFTRGSVARFGIE